MATRDETVRSLFDAFSAILDLKCQAVNELVAGYTLSLSKSSSNSIKKVVWVNGTGGVVARFCWIPAPDTFACHWNDSTMVKLSLIEGHKTLAEPTFNLDENLNPAEMVERIWPSFLDLLEKRPPYFSINELLEKKARQADRAVTPGAVTEADFQAFAGELRKQLEATYPNAFGFQQQFTAGALSTVTIASANKSEILAIAYFGARDNCTVVGVTNELGDGHIENSFMQFEQDVPLSEMISKGVMPGIAHWLVDFNRFAAVLSNRCSSQYSGLTMKPAIEQSAGRNGVSGRISVRGRAYTTIVSLLWKDLDDGSRFVRVVSPEQAFKAASDWWKDDPDRPDAGTFNFGTDVPVSKIVDCESFWWAFGLAVHSTKGHQDYVKKPCLFCTPIG
jgi:hypothetical protein